MPGKKKVAKPKATKLEKRATPKVIVTKGGAPGTENQDRPPLK